MCCVGRMVEETTCEATDHEFEPYGVCIYPDAFFTAATAGTKGPGCPVLVSPFLAMIPGIQGCFSHHVVKVGGINSPNKHVLDMLPDEGEVLSLCNTLNPRSSSFYAFCLSNQEIENPTQSRDTYNAGHA